MFESLDVNQIGGLTYGGMFILALIANMVVPVPEEIVLIAVGYFSAKGQFNFLYSYGIFVAGMFVSDTILYFMAYKGSRITKRLQRKIENNRHLKDEGFVQRHIRKIIFISRFLMYLRWIGPVISGVARVPYKKFAILDFLALLVYVPLILFLGFYFENYIDKIISDVNRIRNIFMLIFSIIVLIFIAKNANKKFLRSITETIDEYTPTWIPGLSVKKDKFKNVEKKPD
jgi:membrane protein DedA with SNARE-associated domain